MKKYNKIIGKSRLFMGIDDSEIDAMVTCLSAKVNNYKKSEYIFRFGENISTVGLVLAGDVHIIKEDYWGNRIILSDICEGQIFGEAYACSDNEILTVSAVAANDCEVILFDVKHILTVCSSDCSFHARLIQNLVTVLAEKNIMLTNKIEHMAQRRLRDKILSYLSEQSKKQGSPSFNIPYNRQELADYLSVDRSAMSNELCKLRDEGVLTFKKNEFKLL